MREKEKKGVAGRTVARRGSRMNRLGRQLESFVMGTSKEGGAQPEAGGLGIEHVEMNAY